MYKRQIPGSNTVGIELPKISRENVFLREIISDKNFKKREIKLPIALGKSISGEPITSDLSSMPHLLIAGTTGSGKSVCINTIILSLIYKHTPDVCKFILIDPKMLELSTYEGIPHLLCPVITEAKKAASVLGWVVKEMESRYRLMTKVGVRNIDGYNEKHKVKMPYIVVIVDEMSDLMLVAGKEIENYIQKLSQMARAAGIHIIMATQRPSVDVITGTIKANFPTRISFQVTSKIDSRTILGEQGAEQLLGKGDMLYMSYQPSNETAVINAGKFIRSGLGPLAIASEIAIEGGIALNKTLQTGVPFKTAFADSIFNMALGPKLQIDKEAELEKEFARGEEFAMAERGRRMGKTIFGIPLMAQSEQADKRRQKERMEQMISLYPQYSDQQLISMIEDRGFNPQDIINQKTTTRITPAVTSTLTGLDQLRTAFQEQDALQKIATAGGVANLAGGGIAGLSGGKKSGPPPISGPTPDGDEGLPAAFKSVRKR